MRRVLVTILGALVLLGTAALPAQAQGPTLLVDGETAVAPGTEVVINGNNWPTSELVVIETCGNAGLGGSNHCDLVSSTTVPTGPTGEIAAKVRVGQPPSPCPCILQAYVVGTLASAKAPITILGAPVAPPVGPPAEDVERLEVVASMQRTASWTAWFGAAPEHMLVLEVRNISEQAIGHAALDVGWGRGVNPTGYVEAPVIEDLGPSATVRVEIPVTLDPLAFGNYTVQGGVVGHAGTAFAVETTTYPFGLLAIPALGVALLVLVKLRNALARAFSRRMTSEPAGDTCVEHAPEVTPTSASVPDATDDESQPAAPGPAEIPAAEQEPAWSGS